MKELKIRDVMDKNPPIAEVPGRREDALRILAKYEVSGVPIVKAGTKKFAGIVTRKDIFMHSDEDQLAILMNKNPVTISPDASIKRAAKIFYEKRIHGIPVIKRGELIGVVSPKDVLRIISKTDGYEVEKYLSPFFIPIYEETPLPVVMKIFRVTDISAMPVLDDNGKLTGIVSDGDLFNFSLVRETVSKSDIGIGEDEDIWTWEGIRDVIRLYYETSKIELPSVPVKEVMIKNVITVYRKSKLAEVAKKMVDNNINQMPVMDEDDELIGVIHDIDLMKALL